ncbi:structural maintenance of chromosomes protein 1 [[Candida] railenensis]|uniref:Structural maintenance of chromosomes protein n=1 Tax=[Candida] railenensis TaxID=45579 RepID=A0A9P0VZN5_9ASCO|nr:structural maintenance of chromosomes protein 1 [[Candida] railenensis]
MGRLIGLELNNFKSYRGTSTIGFGSSFFTSIIGPNGAGKSNMMDAISFVLGIKSSQLRSQNVKDLIYRGRIGETSDVGGEEGEEIVARRAYVSAIYEKDDGEKLTLQRLITSSNGSSEYRINGRAVTALQYSSILKRENILIKARNFLVFQGDVEAIASQSPKDLTSLIETISGSSEYTKEYDELVEQREAAHEEANSVFARKRVLNSESKQYKEQMLEQESFEKKLIEKYDLIKLINLYKLYHNEMKHKENVNEIKSEKAKLDSLKKKLKVEENSLKSLMSEYSKDQLKLKRIQTKIDTLKGDIEDRKRDIIPLEAQKKSVTNKINLCRNKIKEFEREIVKQTNQVKSVEKQLNEGKRMYDEFTKKVLEAATSGNISIDCQQEYESLRDLFLKSGGSQLEETLSLVSNEKDTILASISNLQKQVANSSKKTESIQSIIKDDLESKLSSLTTSINDILTLKKSKETTRSNLLTLKEEAKYKELQLNTQLRDILIKLDELSSQQRESQKQRKLRENVSMLKKMFPNQKTAIRGLVYDLVRPSESKYETSLSTLLGRNFDSIIVESTSIAYKCIEIFKERRCGVATFIPLDMVSNRIELGQLRRIGDCTPGLDVVEYDDSSLENAIEYIIGDAIVCDNIEIARKLKWDGSKRDLSNKIITLNGSIIDSFGLMTGGKQDKKVGDRAAAWDRNEWKKLSELKDELLAQLSDLNDSKPKMITIKQLVDEIDQLEDKLPLLRNQKQSIERVIKDRWQDVEYHKRIINENENLIKQKRDEIATKIDKEYEETNKKIRKLQDKIYTDFCNKFSFEGGIQGYEDLYGSALRSRTKEKSQYLKAITTLTSMLNFEKERLGDSELRKEKAAKQLEEYERLLLSQMEQIESMQSEKDELEAELEILTEEQLKVLSKKTAEKFKFIKSFESNVEDIQNETSEENKTILSLEENLLKIDSERLNILKNCKIENIILPLKEGELDQLSIEGGSEEVDCYGIDIDYDMVGTKLREAGFSTKVEAELQSKLEQVLIDLESLTPNAKAVERLRSAETKLKEFDRDFTKARQKENKILEKFNSVKNKRYELFMGAFKHISEQIDNTYKELTKSKLSTLGGSAYLTLEDEDEPYLAGIKYHAMPPMKRFRDMELLSGGEKTIAALALLFAIHSFQPSPFFVLDEVDAALDNSNVAKIANYIRKHAGPHFQFIVISLKNSLFEKSDALLGIYRDQVENSSRTVTLDLREYPEEPLTQDIRTQQVEA